MLGLPTPFGLRSGGRHYRGGEPGFSISFFGTRYVLIPYWRNYGLNCAFWYFNKHFSEASEYYLQMILNCSVAYSNLWTILIRTGIKEPRDILHPFRNPQHGVVWNVPCDKLRHSVSHPASIYTAFMERNDILDTGKQSISIRSLLL